MESSEAKQQIPVRSGSTKLTGETFERGPGDERSVLYEKGLQFKRNASYSLALQCFLGCIQDIKEGVRFAELPHCLRNIAEIYSTLGEFEKAVEFVQAEKLFYETALIQAGRKESHDKERKQPELIDPNANSEEAQLANEYDKLTQMCLKENKIQLALEYAGKATQLRKKIYGDLHPITTKSLNQFTLIYAEMGKKQYTAAMEKFSKKEECDEALTDQKSKENSDEMINDSNAFNQEKSSQNRTENEEDQAASQKFTEEEKDEVDSGTIVLVYFLLTLAVSLVLTAVVCHLFETDLHSFHSCQNYLNGWQKAHITRLP